MIEECYTTGCMQENQKSGAEGEELVPKNCSSLSILDSEIQDSVTRW